MANTVKTLIKSPTFGKFVFDAVFHTDHQSNVTVTQHPVQVGAPISDHAYQEPDEVTMEIGMSDAMIGVGNNHSVNAYNTLRAIQAKREPVTLVTRLWTYQNMVLTSISAPDDQSTMYGLKATLYFQSVDIVKVSVVKVQQTVSGSRTGGSSGSSGSTGGRSGATTATPTRTTGTPTSTGSGRQSILSQLVNGKK